MGESTSNLFLNQRLERYEIQERIGSGGMARVYKAHDKNLDRTVAVKVLHEHLTEDPTFLQRFQREAKLVALFNHPNIVQIYDFNTFVGEENSQLAYMVMPYIPGNTLRDLLQDLNDQDKMLANDRIQQVMDNLLDALGYAHDRGMIHRDVKPANIIFDERQNAILTDFGIARMTAGSNLTQEGVTVGTPAYMSPEQATGDTVDGRSDLYAAGIILYEMITGRPPFEDDGSLSVLLKHLNEPVPSLSEFVSVANPHLDAVVQKALSKSFEDRYQTADEFKQDLALAFSGNSPIHVGNSTTKNLPIQSGGYSIPATTNTNEIAISSSPKSTGQSPYMLLVGGLAVIAIILFLGILNLQRKNADNSTSGNTVNNNDTIIDNSNADDASSMVAMPIYFDTEFTSDDAYLDYWPQDDFNNVKREMLSQGGYRIENARSGRAIPTIFDIGNDYLNFAIEADITLEDSSTPNSAYGVIFRYVDEDNYNVFGVDGLGQFSIWTRQNGQWVELRNEALQWTPNEAVNRIGALNKMVIEVMDDTFTGYVNGEQIFMLEDSTFATGRIGIYTAVPANGEMAVVVSEYQIRVIEEADNSAESMTCNSLGRGNCNEISPTDTPVASAGE